MKWSRMSLRIENNNNANDDVGWQHESPQSYSVAIHIKETMGDVLSFCFCSSLNVTRL